MLAFQRISHRSISGCFYVTISQVLESRIRPTMQQSTHLRASTFCYATGGRTHCKKQQKIKLQAMGCLGNRGINDALTSTSDWWRRGCQTLLRLSNAAELLGYLVSKWQTYWKNLILDDQVNCRQILKRGTIVHSCLFGEEKVLQEGEII